MLDHHMKVRLILLFAIGCTGSTLQPQDISAVTATATNQFQVTGMNCEGCARGIVSELKRVPGVVSAEVTFSNKLARVAYETNRVSVDGLKKAIVDAGYGAKLIKSRKTGRP